MTSKLVDQALFLIGDVGTIGGMVWLEQQLLQREWVSLTHEELIEIYNQKDWDTTYGWDYEQAIEAKLKEKNI